MKYAPLLALLLVGCSDMAVSPVAPSATSPAGATTPIAPVVLPTPVPTPIPSPQPPRERPSPPIPLVLIMSAARIRGTATSAEWRFSVGGGPDQLSDIVWSFGDGAGASESATQQHIYTAEGPYTVRATVQTSAHGQQTVTRDIIVTFEQ